MRREWQYYGILGAIVLALLLWPATKGSEEEQIQLTPVEKRDFLVEVGCVGELEAGHSTQIASQIRGDQAKAIYVIADGNTVKPGDLLIKIDPLPFEEKVEMLKNKCTEQNTQAENLKRNLEVARKQLELERKTSQVDLEIAQMEHDRIIKGDGPLENSKLKANYDRALSTYSQHEHLMKDLASLEQEGFLSPSEKKKVEKKFHEEEESFNQTKLQYETYSGYVLPMTIKKAESAVDRCQIKKDDIERGGSEQIVRDELGVMFAMQFLQDMERQLKEAERDLEQTEIYAPSPGMVVLREEYHGGQRRKLRVGDQLIKNQVLIDIPDLDKMKVKTKVREVDLHKVRVGIPVTVEVDAYPNLALKGRVESVGVLAMSDVVRAGDEKVFEVKIILDETDTRLRPGMTARVAIHCDAVNQELSIPIWSVFEKNKKPFVYVCRRGGQFEERCIEVGSTNEQWASIAAGLSEGERIALSTPPPERVLAP